MKRFWKDVDVAREGDGWAIRLDDRPVRTPARALLAVPTVALAEAIADEWRAANETIDPRQMPMTGLANAAIDHAAADRRAFAAMVARYAQSDLICYRAGAPRELADLQKIAWDRLLSWARRHYDVDFNVTEGISHVDQPPGTAERLSHAVEALDPFRLAALAPLVTIGGSLVAALALVEGAITPQDAWDAVTIDDRWQIAQWGHDAEAEAMIEARARDFFAGARFLDLLRD